MMRGHRHIRQLRRLVVLLVASFGLASVGCMNSAPLLAHRNDMSQIVVPPDGSVPRELAKITLPEYVIEPPDKLRIEVGIRQVEIDPEDKDKKKPLLDKKTGKKVYSDQLRSTPLQPVWGEYAVRPDGTVFLGIYNSVPVAGLSLKQAAAAIRGRPGRACRRPHSPRSPPARRGQRTSRQTRPCLRSPTYTKV